MVVNSHPLYQLSYPGICVFGKKIRLEKYHIKPVLSMGYLRGSSRLTEARDSGCSSFRIAQSAFRKRTLSYFLALFQLHDNELCNCLERVEYTGPVHCTGFEVRKASWVDRFFHFFERYDIRQVSFVVLDDIGEFIKVIALLRQVYAQVLDTLDICLHALDLRISHEHNAIHALEDQFPARVVEYLAGYGVEMEPGFEAADLTKREREKVEEQCSLGLSGQGDHLTLAVGIGLFIDPLQVGGLPAQARAVVNDFAVDLSRRIINKGHGTVIPLLAALREC